MNSKIEHSKLNLENIASINNINEIVFMGLMTLCFMGDVIGEISDHAVIIYWLLMTPIFFLASSIIEKAQAIKSIKLTKSHLRLSVILWGSAFFSVLNIMFLWHAEILAVESVGLIIHVILGHTLLVSGTFLGTRFYITGIVLLLLAWFTIAMEAIVGMLLALLVLASIIGLHLKSRSNALNRKKIRA